MGIIFTALGFISIWILWNTRKFLAVTAIIVTLFQISSLNEMLKNALRKKPRHKVQTFINLISSIIITIIFFVAVFT